MRSFVLSTLASLAWLASGVLAQTLVLHDSAFVPDHVLHVTAQNISIACDNRYSAVVNGTSPGPPIRIQAGTAAWIRVYNDMEDANLTMHWHGLAQNMAQFSDGSPLGSQWPIPPLRYFDYEIQAGLHEAGTYFYHSHVGIQALTVTGSIIIEDCKAPYAYDDERVLLFHEHYLKEDVELEHMLLASPLQWTGEVQALMLNGAGVTINKTAGELGDAAADPSCQLPIVEVEPGKTYRFRFIAATSLAHSSIGFEDHTNLTIIAVDGSQYTQPAETDRMQLGSGQRFDILFTTKTEDALAGRTDFHIQFETRDRPKVYTGYGILRYKLPSGAVGEPITAAPAEPIISLPNITYDWMENVLAPLTPDPTFPTLEEVTRRVILDQQQLVDPNTNQTIWKIAGLNWNEIIAFQTPLLVDIYQHGDAAVPDLAAAEANGGWDPRTKSFPLHIGEVFELVLQNTGSLVNNGGGLDVHPFHAHGQHYYDLGSGNGTYDAEAVEAARVAAGYTPVLRDTTLLYRYGVTTTPGVDAGWRAWRYRVTDPGVWMIHCHTLQHMIMGMQSVWVVGNASQIQTIPTDLSEGYFAYGGSVTGNGSTTPQVVEQFDHNMKTCNATRKVRRNGS